MGLKIGIVLIGLFITLIIIGSIIFIFHADIINIIKKDINTTLSITPSPTSNPIPSVSTEPNNTFDIPPNDFVITHINWSYYPNLQTGYVYSAYISEPTSVIQHKFIEVDILTEVKGTENKTIIKEQLAGIAKEARSIYGPNSDINIHGTKDGGSAWLVSLLPYENEVIS